MFCAVAISDTVVLEKISKECGAEYNPECTLNLLFILEDRPSGVAFGRFVNPKTILIEYVGLIESAKGKGYGDFLTRSMINKVMDLCETVEANSTDDYFLKFGFVLKENKMVARSKDIIFPSKCKH